MAGLAGLAFELVGKMIDQGLQYKEDSELAVCKRTLRRYKEAYNRLKDELDLHKEHSDQIISHLQSTISELRRQAIKLTENNNDLMSRLSAAYIKETTGGVASLEEYDEAMQETEEE
jgi:CII-binding regulator of phage lambda lysogenization HflD